MNTSDLPPMCAGPKPEPGCWNEIIPCNRRAQPGKRHCRKHDPDRIRAVQAKQALVQAALQMAPTDALVAELARRRR